MYSRHSGLIVCVFRHGCPRPATGLVHDSARMNDSGYNTADRNTTNQRIACHKCFSATIFFSLPQMFFCQKCFSLSFLLYAPLRTCRAQGPRDVPEDAPPNDRQPPRDRNFRKRRGEDGGGVRQIRETFASPSVTEVAVGSPQEARAAPCEAKMH